MNQSVNVQVHLETSAQSVANLQNSMTSALSAVSQASASQNLAGGNSNADTNMTMKVRNSVQTNITQEFLTKIEETINAQQFITTVGNNNVYDSVFLNQLTNFVSATITTAVAQTSIATETSTDIKASASASTKSIADSVGEMIASVAKSLADMVGGLFNMAIMLPILIIGGIGFVIIMIVRSIFGGSSSKAAAPQYIEPPKPAVGPDGNPIAPPGADPNAPPPDGIPPPGGPSPSDGSPPNTGQPMTQNNLDGQSYPSYMSAPPAGLYLAEPQPIIQQNDQPVQTSSNSSNGFTAIAGRLVDTLSSKLPGSFSG